MANGSNGGLGSSLVADSAHLGAVGDCDPSVGSSSVGLGALLEL